MKLNWSKEYPEEDGYYVWIQKDASKIPLGGIVKIGVKEIGWLCKDGLCREVIKDRSVSGRTMPEFLTGMPIVLWSKIELPDNEELDECYPKERWEEFNEEYYLYKKTQNKKIIKENANE